MEHGQSIICEFIFADSSNNRDNHRLLTNYLTSSGYYIEIGVWYFHVR